MRQALNDILGRFGPVTRFSTATATTSPLFFPPWRGPLAASPFVYTAPAGVPNWYTFAGRTVLTSALYTTGATAHTITLVRPKNWTYFPAGWAKNLTLIPNGTGAKSTGLFDDPGVYSTNYKYPSPITTGTASLGDNAIGTGDYVAYQLTDGTWQLDKVASGTFNSALTLGTGTPNVTGGGVPVNGVLFFFGIAADSDPGTALACPSTLSSITVSRANLAADDVMGFMSSLHPGDPLLLISNNATNPGSWEGCSGYYSRL